MFNSTSFKGKIQWLTVTPVSWSTVKVKNELNISYKLLKRAKSV